MEMEKAEKRFSVGMTVMHWGVKYEIIDCYFGETKGKWLYDLSEKDGEGAIYNVPEDELTVCLYDGERQRIYVVTASGCAFSTEVRIAYDEDEANEVARELFSEMNMDGSETEEVGHGVWKGYSTSANCEVEIEIHEKDIERR